MKKALFALFMVLLLVCAGCSQSTENTGTGSAEGESAAATPRPELPEQTTTLMVYMVGSDLEAKVGAATADLEEMANSGIDLSKHNVVVYAGGTPGWHNEVADPQKNTVLQLTESGFTEVASFPNVSMGDSRCLTEFLSYAAENYPAERYALILWDHGNGPVMGYGKDIRHQGDGLLLEEMRQAMEASPFGPENKLCWVGFDACLMASAELSCMWAEYADYLVASQEVEPSFGWNYAFLNALGDPYVPEFLTEMTNLYLETCRAYYEQQGFGDRDTTLSCVDLSKADELEAALNALFGRAVEDGSDSYVNLAVCRGQTRALGRSSTGSEYDLVDLQDLTARLEALYPDEAAQVKAVLAEMVVANTTNADDCCGISLYFPFYNKQYYEHSWQATYSEMNCLTNYREYLRTYEENWLNPQAVSGFDTGFTPKEKKGEYVLELTPEQAKNYVSARYCILRQEDDLYQCLFYGTDVTREDNILTANFSGKVLKLGGTDGFIPPAAERERIGDMAHYFIPFVLRDMSIGFGNSMEVMYHVVLNTETGKAAVCSVQPGNAVFNESTLLSGKQEDVDVSQWPRATFLDIRKKQLTRDENGVILPVEEWPEDSWITGIDIMDPKTLEIVYEPLDAGEYFLVMEVRDVYGNRYCSELFPIESNGRKIK